MNRINFNPRAPCGARRLPIRCRSGHGDFNPRAPCGARRHGEGTIRVVVTISIRAPRAGRDACACSVSESSRNFNPRAPCGARRRAALDARTDRRISIRAPRAGRDKAGCWPPAPQRQFQSARPVRGATLESFLYGGADKYFNPRAPCGARQQKCTNCLAFFQ